MLSSSSISFSSSSSSSSSSYQSCSSRPTLSLSFLSLIRCSLMRSPVTVRCKGSSSSRSQINRSPPRLPSFLSPSSIILLVVCSKLSRMCSFSSSSAYIIGGKGCMVGPGSIDKVIPGPGSSVDASFFLTSSPSSALASRSLACDSLSSD